MEELISKNLVYNAIVEWASEEECAPIGAGAFKAAEIVSRAPTVEAVTLAELETKLPSMMETYYQKWGTLTPEAVMKMIRGEDA